VLLSATSRLVQVWYARTSAQREPYHLFALSNLASLLCAFELSIAHRAAHRRAPAGDTVVGALCDFCSAVRSRGLVRARGRFTER